MILAIDIGNTTIGIGVFSHDTLILYEKISSGDSASSADYINQLNTIFQKHNISVEQLEGSIISSVVPRITDVFKSALEILTQKKVLLLSYEMHLGFELRVDYPDKVGCDRLADATGAIHGYGLPLITIDMGTATTINVIDSLRHFRGGIIMPGIGTAHQALLGNTAQLPEGNRDMPCRTIGANTQECITSGMIYGNACALDGLIRRINEELGQCCTVVATGGFAESIIPYCESTINLDPHLLMKGLHILYQQNE